MLINTSAHEVGSCPSSPSACAVGDKPNLGYLFLVIYPAELSFLTTTTIKFRRNGAWRLEMG